ncbi:MULTISPECIES: site-specific DNA-methyltransferase [unclassified Bacillus (in: firmicutes)]|uniref:site-specific DNA-methyltransferase n=1 Tax=unclassified Bacillus (in: firmicutes) TaxID=185979 RepID=UPI00163B7E60|nr:MULTISPECIES: site-specific DNA-methyltransferase [unclassified Bacillus (in: firmicutes)]QNH48690.1 site-specific DNA-methyltransferase [Bacillus sp. PAMC28571]QNK42985.1 site-specific DNA-methyltransferase [Bacillus sp. PAMC22265]
MGKDLLGSLELGRIYQMDCLDGMKLLPDNSVNMILCDLPYGTTKNEWDSIIPLDLLWEQYKRIIKGNGAIILFGSQPFTTDLINSNRNNFRYEIVWEKSIGYNPLLCKKQPLKTHENILVFYKDLSEVKHSVINYKELRDYFKELHNQIGHTKKTIIERVGQSADHCFRYNSSQWSLPTKETYEKIQSEFGLAMISYEELKRQYDYETEELNKFTYNPQMSKGKLRDKKPGMRGNKEDDNWGGALKEINGIENINDEYYPRSVVYFSNANQRGRAIWGD